MITLWIPGVPVPQGSKKGFRRGRGVQIVDDNKDVLKPWRDRIAKEADVGHTFDCPVIVACTFFMPSPKTPRWPVPAVKPDVDKLVRALLDGLQDGGLLAQDSRVVELHALKRYADGDPGVAVVVAETEDDSRYHRWWKRLWGRLARKDQA